MGCTSTELDALRLTVRQRESNVADFFCDAMVAKHVKWNALIGRDEKCSALIGRDEKRSALIGRERRACRYGVDLALFNGGGIRGDALVPVGNLSKRTLAELEPFGNKARACWGSAN